MAALRKPRRRNVTRDETTAIGYLHVSVEEQAVSGLVLAAEQDAMGCRQSQGR